jgi:hypothetical protein
VVQKGIIAAKRRFAPTAIKRNQWEITWRNLLEELPNFSFSDKDYALNVFNVMTTAWNKVCVGFGVAIGRKRKKPLLITGKGSCPKNSEVRFSKLSVECHRD